MKIVIIKHSTQEMIFSIRIFALLFIIKVTFERDDDHIRKNKMKINKASNVSYSEYPKKTDTQKWQAECNRSNWDIKKGCNISGLLQSLLSHYDKRLRPLMNEQRPVLITVGFWILSIDSINVLDMDYQIDFFFRQSWIDKRLSHAYPRTLTVSNLMLDKIWIPDTYFENSKHSHFHEVTVDNKMLKIEPDGTILYNARISVRASCPMDLRMFPLDVQECDLNIESYGYSMKDIVFQWEPESTRISIGRKVRTLPQYNLTGFRTVERKMEYIVGNFSGLTATFILERRTGYFFLHLYAPCALIVMISWISFCIPKDATAARVALGITSVLTITTILNMLNTAMPKVSYIKALDWYLIVSFLFVFAVLMEYTLVLYLNDRERRRRLKQKKRKKRRTATRNGVRCSERQQNGFSANSLRRPSTDLRLKASYYNREQNGFRTDSSLKSTSDMRFRAHYPGTKVTETSLGSNSEEENTTFSGKPLILLVENGNNIPQSPGFDFDDDRSTFLNQLKDVKTYFCCHFRVERIDEYSRMIFPLSFIIFNTVYWLLFFNKKRTNYI